MPHPRQRDSIALPTLKKVGHDGAMEATESTKQPKARVTRLIPVSQPGLAPIRVRGQVKPLTGRAGALAAVARLYGEPRDELKQLADA